MIILGTISIIGAQRMAAMHGPVRGAEHVEITFNNYPDDTYIILNGGLVKITPTRKNIKIKGVKNVLIQTKDTFIMLFTIEDLQNIQTINVNQDAQTGEYIITTE